MGFVYQISVKPDTPGECGLPKKEVPSARVTVQGVEGDANHYRFKKINQAVVADRAVLLIPSEILDDLNAEGDWGLKPGDLGENITTKGIPYNAFAPGKHLRIGAELEIRIHSEATPCGNLRQISKKISGNYQDFKKTLEGRRGWYARVVTEGTINKHESIEEILVLPGGCLGLLSRLIKRKEM